ncbi:MAG: hypothetical protein HFE76_11790 [Firmicutes bacterium]|nr:hypothetical protein [Bacillota bacterium]
MERHILGVPYEEIVRQCAAHTLVCDSNSPLQRVGISNPCIEGGKKILADEKSKDFFRRVYRGGLCDE